MQKENSEIKQPKKRISPIVVPTIEEETSKEDSTKNSQNKKSKQHKTTNKIAISKAKTTATKKSTTKKTIENEKKTNSKKTTSKKITKPKIDEKKITSTKIDPRTGTIKQVKEKKPKEDIVKVEIVETEPKKKSIKPKVKKPSIKSAEVTIEPAPRDHTPKEIVRPTPKKTKQWTKEEKILYKNLEEAFNTVANMANVIEERTMDVKNIPDLTIGELHVIEMVNKYNNKPMTLIAKKMHVTVGSLTIGVNRLVQKGYLLRIRDEMDRRVILLSITQQGKKVLKFHDKFHDDILGLVLDTIPLAQAVKVMNQFAYVLELYYDPSIADEKTNKKEKR